MEKIEKHNLKILYLGTPEISSIVLSKLIENNFNIVGVIAQPDKEKDRKGHIIPVATKQIALVHNIPVYQFDKIRNHYEEVKQLEFDIILTMAYGQIISEDILRLPRLGAYNLHGSLLPKYRGAAPIQFALLNGDKETGVTLMEMVKEMDAGKMFYKVKVPILDEDNFTTLSKKIAYACFEAFDQGIEDVINGLNKGIEQNIEEVSFTAKISNDVEMIDFNQSSEKICNIIRAISMNIGGYFIYNDEKFKVFSALPVILDGKTTPGKISKYDKNGFFVETKNGYIDIKILQKPGKKISNFKDFYNGNQKLFTVGQIIK